jgi:flagellar hook-length control protein FliK
MPDMIQLATPTIAPPAPIVNSAAAPATDAQNGNQDDDAGFAAVLRGKTYAQSSDQTPSKTQNKDTSKASSKDPSEQPSKDNSQGDPATASAAAVAPNAAAPDAQALAAAALANHAPRYRLPLAVDGGAAGDTATGATGATGSGGVQSTGNSRDWLARLTAAADPNASQGSGMGGRGAPGGGVSPNPTSASDAADSSAAGATGAAPSSPAATTSNKTSLTDIMNQTRGDAPLPVTSQAPAADLSPSTLAMLQPASGSQAQGSAAVYTSAQIEAPVGTPRFADEAAQRVTWMATNGIEHAEIRVNPPDMGPIQVSIDMHQNEASIHFVVSQTDTRVAVEDSLHRLEAMLADSGIALSQASVGQRDTGQASGGDQSGYGARGGTGTRGNDTTIAAATVAAAGRSAGMMRGLVDTFA